MSGQKAVLISYDARSDRFDSMYERNKFYRGLFGYKQTVRRNDKVYHYDKDGLLDEVPHIKVEDSVFIVPRKKRSMFRDYFQRWRGKVEVHMFKITLEDRNIKGLNHGGEQR